MIMNSNQLQRQLALFCLFLIFTVIQTAPVNEDVTFDQAMSFLSRGIWFAFESYLQHYNYMGSGSPDPSMASITDPGTIKKALEHLQAMGHINITGEFDEETKKLMQMPRCGMSDNVNMASMTRKKRYVQQGSKWGMTCLTYKFVKYGQDMSLYHQEKEIARAFKVWSDVTPLTFRKVRKGPADIEILFGSYAHGDNYPFDGPGSTLAHAFYPMFGGDAHFDESEKFTLYTHNGTNLFQVAAHEFGHSLGLSHSSYKSALMYPFYGGYQPNFTLDSDVIAGIQSIYGAAPKNKPPGCKPGPAPTTAAATVATTSRRRYTTSASISPDYCNDGQFDDIISLEKNGTFGFRGRYYYKIGPLRVEQGYPRNISQDWQGLPSDIDAAISYPPKNFTRYNRTTARWERGYTAEEIWFFKGSNIYKYNSKRQRLEAPQRISSVIQGLPDNVNAAFIWSGNGRTYFTKGNKYYRLNEDKTAVDVGYPRPLSSWTSRSSEQHRQQINNSIDAAFKYANDRTYFFVGSNYYRFNDQAFKVDDGYPRSVAVSWYGCSYFDRLEGSGINEMTNITNNFETMYEDPDEKSQDNRSHRISAEHVLVVLLSLLLLSLF